MLCGLQATLCSLGGSALPPWLRTESGSCAECWHVITTQLEGHWAAVRDHDSWFHPGLAFSLWETPVYVNSASHSPAGHARRLDTEPGIDATL